MPATRTFSELDDEKLQKAAVSLNKQAHESQSDIVRSLLDRAKTELNRRAIVWDRVLPSGVDWAV